MTVSVSSPQGAALTANLIAGLAIAGLLLPEAVAYSSIAHMPPQMGVIALFAGLVAYGLIGKSRFAIVSATSSSAAVMAAATLGLAPDDATLRVALSLGLVLVTGVFFILAGLARLGDMTTFIAKPVLRGFAFGLAVVIIVKQIASMVGIHPQHEDILRFIYGLCSQWADWNVTGLLIGVVSWLLLSLLSRIPNMPASLVVIALGIGLSHEVNLGHYGVPLVGRLDLNLSWPHLPVLTRDQWGRLLELGFAMVMILYAESYGSIRGFAVKHGDPFTPNRDLIALGVANVCSGLFQGMPVGAGYSGTSANEAAGATSRLAGLMAAAGLALMVLTVLPAIALTPHPVLAAIVVHVLGHTLNPAVFRPYFHWRRDRVIIFAAIFSVLMLGVLDGLLAAIGISLMLTLRRFSESNLQILGRLGEGHDFVSMAAHPQAQSIPGILILRPNEPIFFANADRILLQAMHLSEVAGSRVHTVIVSLEESFDLDSTSLEALQDFNKTLLDQGQRLILARLKDSALQVLQRITPALPPESLCGLSVDDAVRLATLPQSLSKQEQLS